jgi:IS1 family transposase/transposase-like protein
MKTKNHKLPLDSLACVNEECDLYGQAGQGNLTVRKIYGKDQIRYIRCKVCQEEFSERKKTALWNVKIREEKAIAIAEQLAEGTSIKGTARVVKVDPSTVRRINKRIGKHGEAYHRQEVKELEVKALQADERYGFANNKGHPMWEAELIDPVSKFIISHRQGQRGEKLIRALLSDGAQCLSNPQGIVLFTDGLSSYESLFPEIFGRAYRPARQGRRGRLPKQRYRIPRTAAHVQIVKHRQKRRVTQVEIRYPHGSRKRVQEAMVELGYKIPNTSAIERRNGTARLMTFTQTRRSLAFARRDDLKLALGWWGLTVYNWTRPHRSLKALLPEPRGKKSMNTVLQPWPWAWPIPFYLSPRFSPLPYTLSPVGDNLTLLPRCSL